MSSFRFARLRCSGREKSSFQITVITNIFGVDAVLPAEVGGAPSAIGRIANLAEGSAKKKFENGRWGDLKVEITRS